MILGGKSLGVVVILKAKILIPYAADFIHDALFARLGIFS